MSTCNAQVAYQFPESKGPTHLFHLDLSRDVQSFLQRLHKLQRNGTSVTFVNPKAMFDQQCIPTLAKLARDAGQVVPAWLFRIALLMQP